MGVLLGAVAYDPKVVTIWEGFKAWLRDERLDFDFVLYSNYERQVEDLVDGRIDAAWNSPLAWVRTRRSAADRGLQARALVMRDTDRDLTSLVVTRAEGDIHDVADLQGRRIGTGALDSPQATLLPLSHLRRLGLDPGRDCEVQRFDIGVGLHGDHVGGEVVVPGNIIIRQCGTHIHPGNNVGLGRDYTIYAKIDGRVKFEWHTRGRKKVSVYPLEAQAPREAAGTVQTSRSEAI